jgi:hypothetical protein
VQTGLEIHAAQPLADPPDRLGRHALIAQLRRSAPARPG